MKGNCQDCGKGIVTLRRGFCARCYKRWIKWNLIPDRVCPQCGRGFHHTTGLKREFCSRACHSAYKVGKDNSMNASANYEHRECLVCGEAFVAEGSNIQAGGGKYCSPQCWGIARRTRGIRDIETYALQTRWRLPLGWIRFAGRLVIDRGSACELCKCDTGALCVHHKEDPNPDQSVKLLLNPDNCLVVCWGCHIKLHAGTLESNPGKRVYSPRIDRYRNDKRKTCEVCQKEFIARLARQKACSRSCGVVLRNRKVYGPE